MHPSSVNRYSVRGKCNRQPQLAVIAHQRFFRVTLCDRTRLATRGGVEQDHQTHQNDVDLKKQVETAIKEEK